MGMSSSQARFLTLTARKSDLEYEAQQIAQRRLKLSDSTQEIEAKYSEKMNNTVFKYRPDGQNPKVLLDYDCIKNDATYFLTDLGTKKVYADKKDVPKDAEEGTYVIDNNLYNRGYFEEAIRNGKYFLTRLDTEDESQQVKVDISQVARITEENDESDDDAAKVEYDQKTKQLQKQDKKLELELNRIESNHKAIETEIESVQKIIKQNIEETYKTFS